MSTLFRRGRWWWIRYRVDGRLVRVGLGTDNRKVAEELRRRKDLELAAAVLGVPVPGAVVSTAGGAAGSAVGGVRPAAGTGSGVVPAVAVASAPPVVPLQQVRAEYEAWSKVRKRPHTVRNDLSRLAAFFATVPGKELGEITTGDVERLLTRELQKGRSAATQLRFREILHAFWRWAVRQGYAERNIVTEIPRPRLPERDPRYLNQEQITGALAAVAGDRIAPVVATAIYAGLRREELCWLRWDDVDLDAAAPVLRIRAKTVRGEFWQPKTKRDRKVPLSPKLLEVLKAHRGERKNPTGWLFAGPRGHRRDRDNLSRRLRELMHAAKLPWGFLDFRHTFGSQLAQKGVSLLKIARLMGNSPTIASKHYINLAPEEMAGEVAF